MLPKSKASPYIVTLILSFVLSSYINNLLRIKLKTCIVFIAFDFPKLEILALKYCRLYLLN